MSTIEEKPLTLWEVIRILEKRKGKSQHWDKADQRKVYEYANKFYKLDENNARELLDILTEKFNLPRAIAVQIIDILPVTLEELELIFAELVEIYQHVKVSKEMEISPFLKEVIIFAENFNKLEKEKQDELIKKIIDILREYWSKARKIIPTEGEKKS